jgi:hypothetical protein
MTDTPSEPPRTNAPPPPDLWAPVRIAPPPPAVKPLEVGAEEVEGFWDSTALEKAVRVLGRQARVVLALRAAKRMSVRGIAERICRSGRGGLRYSVG